MARLCRLAGIAASHHRGRAKPQTRSAGPRRLAGHRRRVRPGPSRVHRHRTNQIWLTDITEHRTTEGKLYLCAVKDVFSNRIVGYSIDSRMKSSLVAAALRNAIALRCPVDTICHSDRGSQFRSKRVVRLLKNNGCTARWDASARPGITLPWRVSSPVRRTSWTPGDGIPTKNSGWRSCPG